MENITGVLIDAPLYWHKLGLQETASGYGKKLTTRYKIAHKDRTYRVYACVFGNAGSSFIIVRGEKIFLSDTVNYPESALPIARGCIQD